MHFLFHLIFGAAKAVFFALPGIVAFLIAAASLAVFYMEELQTKLKDQRLIRWVAAIVLLLIGVGAFIEVEKAIETAGLMLGTDKSRGYCLEMICADFLAGATIDDRRP